LYVGTAPGGPWTTLSVGTFASVGGLAISRDGSRAVVNNVVYSLLGGRGDACALDDGCVSRFCTDGVCCDARCSPGDDNCEACAAPLTGQLQGVCAPVLGGRTCRATAGDCDMAESCDGTSTVCPADVVVASGECRPAAGACDTAESCDGASPTCPADAFEGPAVECRASLGACDVAEHCTGTAAACPPDGFLTAVACRPSMGACDPEEVCFGTSADCPSDQRHPSGTVCRASLDLSCDPLESCDGVAAACPTDENMCVVMRDAGTSVGDGGTVAEPPTAAASCGCRAHDGRPDASIVASILGLSWWAGRRRRSRARR
jgi:hypothetical protein